MLDTYRSDRNLTRGHLMLNLVSKPNKEPKVINCPFVNRASVFVKAPLKLPVFVCAMLRTIIDFSGLTLFIIAVFDFSFTKIRMQQIGPLNDHKHNKCLLLKLYLGIIEYTYGCQRCLT